MGGERKASGPLAVQSWRAPNTRGPHTASGEEAHSQVAAAISKVAMGLVKIFPICEKRYPLPFQAGAHTPEHLPSVRPLAR